MYDNIKVNMDKNEWEGIRNKNGRSPSKHYYKVEDIARLSKRSVGTIHNAHCKGELNLDDLESIFEYCYKRKNKRF